MTRAFLAIAPDDALRRALHQCARALAQVLAQTPGEGVDWVPARNYHLTLVFAGEVSRGDLESIIAVLHRVGGQQRPFQCRLEGLGLLPSARRPRALVARVAPCEPLLALQRELLSALGEEGLAFAERHYRPHITLAGIKSRSVKVTSWGPLLDAVDIRLDFPAPAVTLYESELAPGGAIYRSLARVNLGTV